MYGYQITQELKKASENVFELKDDYIKQGYDEGKALDSAVLSMGNSDEIGIKLNKQHKPQTEWSLLALTFLIAVIGIGVMLGLYFFDYTKLKKYAIPMYISAMSLLIITSFIGATVNGAKRWIIVGPFSISSSSFASVLFIISFVGFIEKYRGEKTLGIVKLIGIGFKACK